MDRNEFIRRRRALEELYEADLRFLRAAHESRVRSLEALWLSLEGDAEALPPPTAILLPAAETASPPDPETALPQPAPVPDLPDFLPDIRTAVEDVLPALPSVFQKKDVLQALGWTPSRSSLHRVLSDMVADGLLQFEYLSSGRTPSTYRKG
ncbi:MAG TPA: hypothetical protein VKM72_21430 [Thermoanaerobaculia bacterium]|nr:hypothetical protein [Thermoanaerobaculia bacterium]